MGHLRYPGFKDVDILSKSYYNSNVPTEPISSNTISKLLTETFKSIIHVRDRTYGFVNEAWLVSRAVNTLKSNRRRGLSFGKRWDCDDFSIDLVNCVAKDHAMTGDLNAEAVAVGWIEYVDREVGRHILVWFLTPDQEIKYIEPQTAKLRELSDEEKETVCYVFV